LFAAYLNHFGGGVDGDHFGGSLGEEEGEGSFSGAEVGDDHGGHEAEEGFGYGFPGFAGDVVFAEASGDRVEEAAHGFLAFFDDAARGGLVGSRFGNFGLGLGEEVGEDAVLRPMLEAVEAALAGAAVFDEIGLPELGEVGGDGALAHDENFLQFGDGELFVLKEQKNAEPVWIGYNAKKFDD